jgi:hypothetical protein
MAQSHKNKISMPQPKNLVKSGKNPKNKEVKPNFSLLSQTFEKWLFSKQIELGGKF